MGQIPMLSNFTTCYQSDLIYRLRPMAKRQSQAKKPRTAAVVPIVLPDGFAHEVASIVVAQLRSSPMFLLGNHVEERDDACTKSESPSSTAQENGAATSESDLEKRAQALGARWRIRLAQRNGEPKSQHRRRSAGQ